MVDLGIKMNKPIIHSIDSNTTFTQIIDKKKTKLFGLFFYSMKNQNYQKLYQTDPFVTANLAVVFTPIKLARPRRSDIEISFAVVYY